MSPSISNEELIRAIRGGDADAQDILLRRCKPLVKAKASAYYLTGGDREDIIQEGMIGLYKAIRDYDEGKGKGFAAFASLCVNRQIISAIKASTRQKHIPLNASLSLDDSDISDSSQKTVFYQNDPETLMLGREARNTIEECIQSTLSEMEGQVLSLHLQGQRNTEIARKLHKNEKSIDNALQRVRRKIDKSLRENNKAEDESKSC